MDNGEKEIIKDIDKVKNITKELIDDIETRTAVSEPIIIVDAAKSNHEIKLSKLQKQRNKGLI